MLEDASQSVDFVIYSSRGQTRCLAFSLEFRDFLYCTQVS